MVGPRPRAVMVGPTPRVLLTLPLRWRVVMREYEQAVEEVLVTRQALYCTARSCSQSWSGKAESIKVGTRNTVS